MFLLLFTSLLPLPLCITAFLEPDGMSADFNFNSESEASTMAAVARIPEKYCESLLGSDPSKTATAFALLMDAHANVHLPVRPPMSLVFWGPVENLNQHKQGRERDGY